MAYRFEAILPTDLEYGSPRVRAYNEQGNKMALEEAMDQIDEVRDVALLHSAKYQHALRRYHDHNVKHRSFEAGDLVLRRVQTMKDRHKLMPPWEGPLIVSRIL